MSQWTLFSNHGHVLLVLASDPDARLRDVAQRVGITERAVQKIVRDLQDGGMLSITKQGRRNRYRLHRDVHLRHPLTAHRQVGPLIDLLTEAVSEEAPEDGEPEGSLASDTSPPGQSSVTPFPSPSKSPVAPESPVALVPEEMPTPSTEQESAIEKKGEDKGRKRAAKGKKPDPDIDQGSLF